MAQKASAKKTAKKSPARKARLPARAARKPEPARKAAPSPKPRGEAKPARKVPAAAGPRPAPESTKTLKTERAANLSKQDLHYFRGLLLEKRREILGDVGAMESEAFKSASNLSNMPIHMADVGTDNFEQEFTLGLIESERQILREIQEALIRIDNGTYGVCLGTGKAIPRVRLEAVPWAKYTIEYSRLLESGKADEENGALEEEASGSPDDDEE
jgi:DnaK suppressor protein